MKLRLALPALLGPLTLGCGLFGGESGSQSGLAEGGNSTACQLVRAARGINTGPLPDGCVKIEGGELGQNLTLEVGGGTVTITGWITKDGEAGEYIGFTYETDLNGGFLSVKAGLDSHPDTLDGEWSHPNGTSGSSVKGISNIVFCEGDDPGGDDPGGDDPGGDDPGGDDPGGDNPDPGDDCEGDDPGGEGTDPGGEGTDPGDEGGEGDDGHDGSPDPGGEGTDPGEEGTDDGATDPDGDGTPGGDTGGTPDEGAPDDGVACVHDDECDQTEYCSAGQCIPSF